MKHYTTLNIPVQKSTAGKLLAEPVRRIAPKSDFLKHLELTQGFNKVITLDEARANAVASIGRKVLSAR